MSKGEIVEWVLILVAIVSLWPWVAGYRAPCYQAYLLVVLVVMAIIALRRLCRIKRTTTGTRDD